MVCNKMFTVIAAGLMMAGLGASSHAQSALFQGGVSNAKINLLAKVRVFNNGAGVDATSTFYYTNGIFNVSGALNTLAVKVDADGTRHADTTGYGYYYIGRNRRWAFAETHLTTRPDGSTSLGVTIEDAQTQETLFTTDAPAPSAGLQTAAPTELPCIMGRAVINPAN